LGVDCTIASVRAGGSKIDGGFIAAYDGTLGPTPGIPDVDHVRLIRVSESIADATFTFQGRSVFAYRAVRSANGRALTIISVGSGKRGGLRVIYYWAPLEHAFYMLYAYAKTEQGDLTPAQTRVLGRRVREEFK
jgi:hypothetical protein